MTADLAGLPEAIVRVKGRMLVSSDPASCHIDKGDLTLLLRALDEAREAMAGASGMHEGVGEPSPAQIVEWLQQQYDAVGVMSDMRPIMFGAALRYIRRAAAFVAAMGDQP